MIGQLIDGKAIAAKLRGEVAAAAAALRARDIAPTLAVVLVGDDPASAVYVSSKTKAAREAGVDVARSQAAADHDAGRADARSSRTLNADPIVDGILVQMPLPPQLDSDAVIRALDPAKDVDGLHRDEPRLPRAGPAGVRAVHAEGLHAPAPRGQRRSSRARARS